MATEEITEPKNEKVAPEKVSDVSFEELYIKEQKKSRLLLFGVITMSILFVIAVVIGMSSTNDRHMQPYGMHDRDYDSKPGMRNGRDLPYGN